MIVAILIGCGPGVGGDLGAHASTAYFQPTGGDDVIVWLTDVPCEDQLAYVAALADVESDQAQADVWRSTHPRKFWQIGVSIRVADPLGLERTPLAGVPAGGQMGVDGVIRADLVEYLDWLDVGYWDGSGEGPYAERFVTDGGSGVVSTYVPGERIVGEFAANVADLAGVAAGEVKVRWNAEICVGQ